MSYVRDPYDTDEPPCFCGQQAPGPVLTTAEFCPACGDPDKPIPEPEGNEDERSGWYCPECEKESPHILCVGCKSLICRECGYPCGCEGVGGDYFDLKFENDFAADLPERET